MLPSGVKITIFVSSAQIYGYFQDVEIFFFSQFPAYHHVEQLYVWSFFSVD